MEGSTFVRVSKKGTDLGYERVDKIGSHAATAHPCYTRKRRNYMVDRKNRQTDTHTHTHTHTCTNTNTHNQSMNTSFNSVP